MISKAFNISLFNVGEIKVPEAWCTPSGRCVLRRTEGSGKGDVAQSRLLWKWLLHLHLRDAVCSWAAGAGWRQSAVGSWPQRCVTAAQCSRAPLLIFCPCFSWEWSFISRPPGHLHSCLERPRSVSSCRSAGLPLYLESRGWMNKMESVVNVFLCSIWRWQVLWDFVAAGMQPEGEGWQAAGFRLSICRSGNPVHGCRSAHVGQGPTALAGPCSHLCPTSG